MDGDALVERAHSDPEGSFQCIRVRGGQALGREAMADLAVELDEFALPRLIKRSVAFGTDERHRVVAKTWLLRMAHYLLTSFLVRFFPRTPNSGARQFDQERWDLREAHAVIDLDAANRAPGHTGFHCFERILDNGDSSATLDRKKASGTIIQCSGENDTNDTFTVSPGCAPKKGINRRPMAIFSRSTREGNLAIVEDKMAVGRSDVNTPAFDLFSFPRLDNRNGATAVKNANEGAGSSDMHDHKDRSWQILRKLAQERANRIDPPRGGSNDDNIARSQKTPFSPMLARKKSPVSS